MTQRFEHSQPATIVACSDRIKALQSYYDALKEQVLDKYPIDMGAEGDLRGVIDFRGRASVDHEIPIVLFQEEDNLHHIESMGRIVEKTNTVYASHKFKPVFDAFERCGCLIDFLKVYSLA